MFRSIAAEVTVVLRAIEVLLEVAVATDVVVISDVSSVEPPGGLVEVVDELDEVEELLAEVLVDVSVASVVEVAATVVVDDEEDDA